MPYARQGYLINNKGDTIFYLEAAQHIGGRPNHKNLRFLARKPNITETVINLNNMYKITPPKTCDIN
jgi:hypothetical protein